MQQLAGGQLSDDGGAVAITTQQTLNADGGVVDASSYMQEVELIEVPNANHNDTHIGHLNIDPQQIATLVHFQHQVDLDHELGTTSLMASQNASVSGPAVIHDFQNVLVTDIQLQNAFSHQVKLDVKLFIKCESYFQVVSSVIWLQLVVNYK